MAMGSFYHWFNRKGPEKGVLVAANATCEVNFRNYGDRATASAFADTNTVIGYALGNADDTYSGLFFIGVSGSHYIPGTADLNTQVENIREGKADFDRVEAAIAADPVKGLERALKRHDWTYAYSDDHRYFAAGERSWANIRALMAQVPVETARELFNKARPTDEYTCPV